MEHVAAPEEALMALQLPRLRSLIFTDVVYDETKKRLPRKYEELRLFSHVMRQRRLPGMNCRPWELWHITIPQGPGTQGGFSLPCGVYTGAF
ncbi:hypothetical protein K443DRAFT_14838 [Laccaria amethystina LaAM-08-1]|uniref:Uncharacterized protein n=1 Tax=Laccaria amethystina LaAM-08-1 TaxID=1095629 RepID=A0A0C9X2X7_9AGAR|nr:hypothetical protein K443DRAFT_14838 [Laccaria amethystina LaAM-08-1]